MTAASDADLLRLYARQASQAAFSALVARHLDLVYAAALRQVRSPDLARDVAQTVFIELAREAGKLRPDCVLPAWLHTATRRRAIDLIRGEARRKRREEIACAAALDPSVRHGTTNMDSDLSDRLDEALSRLPASDREALLLRFFSGQSLREVGQGLGLSDDAAQKRVERALERLRSVLRVGGAGGSALTLGTWLSAQAVPVAPAGLASSIAATALSANAALATGAFASLVLMTTTQKILAVAGLALAASIGVYQHRQTQNLRHELDVLAKNRTEETRAWSDRLSALEAENLRLRTDASSSKAALHEIKTEAANPAIAMMLAWVERLQNLKDYLAKHPEATIPEMSLLKDEDWLDAAKAELKTAQDYDQASAKLRSKADVLFHEHIKSALQNFAKQTGAEFPADIAQLAPYFKNPIDPRMLERWTILRESEIEGVRLNRPDGKVVTQKVCIDPRFENRLVFDASRTTSARFSAAFIGVHAKLSHLYKAANAGREPETLADLLPYATTPRERSIIERRGAP
jgi:RNA polymerase sigma factor (sigma-70 family)